MKKYKVTIKVPYYVEANTPREALDKAIKSYNTDIDDLVIKAGDYEYNVEVLGVQL